MHLLLTTILLLTTPAGALDTLVVTTPDPLLEDWRWTEFDRRSGLAGSVLDVFEDRDGNIWFGTNKGAQKYDGLRWTPYAAVDDFPIHWVRRVSQARDGAMWFLGGAQSAEGQRIAVATRLVEATATTRLEMTTHTFEGWGSINGFLEAADGSIWVNLVSSSQTDVNDLRRYVNGSWETVGQPARTAWNIVQDRNGAIWVGGQSGILRYDGVRWRVFGGKTRINRVSVDAQGIYGWST